MSNAGYNFKHKECFGNIAVTKTLTLLLMSLLLPKQHGYKNMCVK